VSFLIVDFFDWHSENMYAGIDMPDAAYKFYRASSRIQSTDSYTHVIDAVDVAYSALRHITHSSRLMQRSESQCSVPYLLLMVSDNMSEMVIISHVRDTNPGHLALRDRLNRPTCLVSANRQSWHML